MHAGILDASVGTLRGLSTPASADEHYRELIEQALIRGRNAKAIWQDLVDDHGFVVALIAQAAFHTRCVRGIRLALSAAYNCRPRFIGITRDAAHCRTAQSDFPGGWRSPSSS